MIYILLRIKFSTTIRKIKTVNKLELKIYLKVKYLAYQSKELYLYKMYSLSILLFNTYK